MVCPTARVIRTMVSKSSCPSLHDRSDPDERVRVRMLNAVSPSASGNPRARHSRWACCDVRPARSATSSPVSSGRAPTIAARGPQEPSSDLGVAGRPRWKSSSLTVSCDLLHVRDVVQLDAAGSLASETTSVPQPKIRSIRPFS